MSMIRGESRNVVKRRPVKVRRSGGRVPRNWSIFVNAQHGIFRPSENLQNVS